MGELQLDIFAPPTRTRRSDPASSRAAARRAAPKAESDAGRILAALQRAGEPQTAEQLAAATALEPYVVRKRLPDPLEKRGLVKATNRGHPREVLLWQAQRSA